MNEMRGKSLPRRLDQSSALSDMKDRKNDGSRNMRHFKDHTFIVKNVKVEKIPKKLSFVAYIKDCFKRA